MLYISTGYQAVQNCVGQFVGQVDGQFVHVLFLIAQAATMRNVPRASSTSPMGDRKAPTKQIGPQQLEQPMALRSLVPGAHKRRRTQRVRPPRRGWMTGREEIQDHPMKDAFD